MRELTFIWPLLIGLLFLLGRGIVFGAEGAEPTTIPVPQSTIVGWLFIYLSLLWALPPWVVARIVKTIKRLIKYFKQRDGIKIRTHEDIARY